MKHAEVYFVLTLIFLMVVFMLTTNHYAVEIDAWVAQFSENQVMAALLLGSTAVIVAVAVHTHWDLNRLRKHTRR